MKNKYFLSCTVRQKTANGREVHRYAQVPPLCLNATDFTGLETRGQSQTERGCGVKKLKNKTKQKTNKQKNTTKPPTTKKEKNNNSLYRIYMITSLTQAEIPEAPGLHPQCGGGPTGSSPFLVRMTPGHNSHFP